MAIDIRAIKIMLDTNIPGKGPIPFTKSMLYNPVLKSMDGFNEYPYFTMDVEFPEGYLNQLPYEQQVGFFFNRSNMETILRKYTNKTDLTTKKGDSLDFSSIKQDATPVIKGNKEDGEKKTADTTPSGNTRKTIINEKEKKLNQFECANKNIMILLRILFPTKYPVSHNISTSYSSVIIDKPEFTLKLTDFLPSFLKQKLFEGLATYSYLKIDSKVYTVSQIIWLNDIYNHKEYGEIVEKFDKLNKWKEKEIMKLKEEITRKHTKFNKQYKEYLSKIKTDELLSLKKLKNFNDENELLTKKAKDERTAYVPPNRELQTIYTEFDNLIDKLIESINKLTKSLDEETSAGTNVEISNISKQLSTYYTSISETKFRQYFTPSNKTILDKFITNLGRDIDDILVLEYILDVYLSRPGINLDFEKDEQKYRDKLKEKYKTYTDFAESIKKYRAPQRESTNIYLQKTIDEFLDNSELIKGLFNFIMNPYNLRKNPIKEELKKQKNRFDALDTNRRKLKEEQGNFYKRMETGVTLLTSASESEPYFEIYLQVNLIGGELNDDNISLVDCMYKGESLGDRLEFLLNQSLYYPWTVKSSRIFFDITKGSAKDTIVAAEKEKSDMEKKVEEAPVEKKPEMLKQGGNNITRKIRENFMRTTRRYY